MSLCSYALSVVKGCFSYDIIIFLPFPLAGEKKYSSCADIKNQVEGAKDGVYTISIGGDEKEVFCNMTMETGGWTVGSLCITI